MKRLLVIEDGHEYEEFARLFLADGFEIDAAHGAAEALSKLRSSPFDRLLLDLRFDRAPVESLVGDLEATAERRFGGDRARAIRHLMDQQGALILGALRAAGFAQPALFVHDFPGRRLANLRRLYGAVDAIAGFDARAMRRALQVTP
ncbi:MAG: hypothetical protein OEY14_10445 [Myxococcales bacterium]|nr:hypothetical protein [Myxococcales bacterium]